VLDEGAQSNFCTNVILSRQFPRSSRPRGSPQTSFLHSGIKRKGLCVSNRNIPLIFKGSYLRLNVYKNRGVLTMNINKRYIVDEEGNRKEVIIPLDDYRKIEELLGWDLDDQTIKQLRQAKKDRDSGNKEAYVDLASI
jgi:hypothetical protein